MRKLSSVGSAQGRDLQSVGAGRELTGLALAPTVRTVVLVGRGEGAGGGEGGELQSEVADIAAALTDRGRTGGTVVTACRDNIKVRQLTGETYWSH